MSAAATRTPRHRRARQGRSARTLRWERALALLVALLLVGVGTASASGSAAGIDDPVAPQSPDSQINVSGAPAAGTAKDGSLVGTVDAHTHLMSDVGFGGDIVCGKTFSEAGIADALKDCRSHGTDGRTALIENLTNLEGKGPFDEHDTTLWPTFADAPKWSSLTHQQMYYRWVERSWRAGQRIMVADAVNNNVLCALPTQVNRYSCDDMDTVRRQIAETKKLEKFVDAQYGGTGKGWFRIAYTPEDVRRIVGEGKLAVVLGMEVSNPFGCSIKLGVPQCTKADIDRGLDEAKSLGIRSMYLCHKFDNALCGVRFDEGTQGVVVNTGNFLNTGQWWQVETCTGTLTDHTVAGGVLPPELAKLAPTAVLPVYPKAPHCNKRGLTSLGEYALRGMMKRNMLVEIDHQSVKAAKRTMEILESEGYPGVVSTHSWMDKAFSERIYQLGGFIAQYGHDADEFVQEGAQEAALRKKYGVGYGFGMDMNGFGGTPAPRADAATTPLVYPFDTGKGQSVDKEVTGERTWDYNTDGVAHYGMVPDWVQDMRSTHGQEGEQVVADLYRGAESWTRTFEAATGWAKGADLTTGRPTSASSTEWTVLGRFRPERATDDDLDTRWASAYGEGQWWQVDLGTARQLRRLTIDWEKAYATDYTVELSGDGTTWRTGARVTGSDGELDSVALDDSARYVRITSVKRATRYGISIHEVQLSS